MTMKLKIISAFSVSILILILIGVFSYENINDYRQAAEWVHHTQKIISRTERMLLDVQDIETEQRGYVITGEEKYLEYYDEGLKNVEKSYLSVKELVKDNSEQLALLNNIYQTISVRVELSKQAVLLRRTQGFESAKQFVSTGKGESIMKKIRVDVDHFIDKEEQFLLQRLNTANENFSSAAFVIIASIILTILIVLITLYFFILDYNKRVESEKKVVASELRIKKILDSLPIGIFIVDAKGKPYYSNAKSQQILGKGIMMDNSLNELPEVYQAYIAGTDELYPASKQSIIRALNGEQIIGLEDVEILRNGIRVPLRVSATYITNAEDKIDYAISIFEDITDVKENEKNLLQAKKMAEESVILKETFLANMSHEIRTPMNAILGFTDILLKRNLGATEKDYMQTIKTSGETLLRIINDILDVSKIDSGMMIFEEHPISIKEIFSSLQILLSHKAAEKNLNLTFDYDHSIPDTILGDPTRLTQIILNIAGNAIKFTKKGAVEVFAKLVSTTKEHYDIEISVKDTGIGIAEDKLQFIFERFRQAEAHTTRNYGGTGLGLSIAKQLIELQGGSLKIKSMEGVGSVFSFTLPFKKPVESYNKIVNQNSHIDFSKLQSLSILLIEDNIINVKFIQSLFSQHGLKTDVAENGKKGIENLLHHHYDLVLMDIEMPEMNGYETTRYIRDELKNDIPIIAMTAHAMAGEKEKCLQLGMNDYISKPINSELLFKKMLIFATNSNIKSMSKLMNLDFLSRTVSGNKKVILDIINVFLEQMPEDMAAINDAVKKANFVGVKRQCHKMKSSVSIMGMDTLVNLLEEMEELGDKAVDMQRIEKLNEQVNDLVQQAIQEVKEEKTNFM